MGADMQSRTNQSDAVQKIKKSAMPVLSGLVLYLTPFGIDSNAHEMVRHAPKAEPSVVQEEVYEGETKAFGFSNKLWRSDQFEISLLAPEAGPHKSELEYKVRMDQGDALTYSWRVENLDDPEEFYFDFHGETLAEPDTKKGHEQSYEKRIGLQKNGYLIAPFAGAHGWYFQNQSAKPVVVHLTISGFYELAYPGSFGNEGGLLPLAPQRR